MVEEDGFVHLMPFDNPDEGNSCSVARSARYFSKQNVLCNCTE